MDKYVKEDDEWQKVEFEKTMNSLKPTFEKNGWHTPRDFQEVREWHYYEISKNPLERADLPERAKIQDREIYIQWAKATQTKKEKTAPPPKALKTLEEMFKEKFGNDKEYQNLKKRLFSKELLSDDLSTWIGTKENGKTQLASVIKYAGQNNLGRKLTNKEVVFISEIDFKNRVDIQTAKNGKYENAEYYFS